MSARLGGYSLLQQCVQYLNILMARCVYQRGSTVTIRMCWIRSRVQERSDDRRSVIFGCNQQCAVSLRREFIRPCAAGQELLHQTGVVTTCRDRERRPAAVHLPAVRHIDAATLPDQGSFHMSDRA